MTTTPDSPAVPAVPSADTAPAAVVEVVQVDAVLTGRAMSAGPYIAGLLTAGQLQSAATPHALVKDLWPDLDPAIVQEIFNRGCATGWMGRGMYARPSLHGEELALLQGQLAEAGFHAMGGMVARSRRLVAPVHPADSEEPRGH